MDLCSSDCFSCDRLVCRCLNITESQLADAIATHDLRSVREVKRLTGAGDGCTCCHGEIKEVLERVSLSLV